MTVVHPFPTHGDVLFDARDAGRALRIGWHPQDGIVVLSIWRNGSCVSSCRLDRADVPRLITQLAEGLAVTPTPGWTPAELVRFRPARPPRLQLADRIVHGALRRTGQALRGRGSGDGS